MSLTEPINGPAGPDRRRRPGPTKRAAIYKADTWHVEDGTATDGTGRPPLRNPIRRAFSAEYKPAVLAEYDACSESGEKGAILRREALYSSIITDWRRQHRQGLLKAAGRAVRHEPGWAVDLGDEQAAGRERTAPPQARPGRGGDRSPGKSARICR